MNLTVNKNNQTDVYVSCMAVKVHCIFKSLEETKNGLFPQCFR